MYFGSRDLANHTPHSNTQFGGESQSGDYSSKISHTKLRRSGSDTLGDLNLESSNSSRDDEKENDENIYESKPNLPQRFQDTLKEAEEKARMFARRQHNSHIVQTLNMARSKSRSRQQDLENYPKEIYRRPENFDPYGKLSVYNVPSQKNKGRQPLVELGKNFDQDNSQQQNDEGSEELRDENSQYDSQSVMPGDISQYSKPSSSKNGYRKRQYPQSISSEVEFAW